MTWRPFFSVLIIIAALLLFTIGQMEQRRMGYLTLRLSHQYKTLKDAKRGLDLQLAQATRPERIEKWAAEEHLAGHAAGRVIAISGGRVALRN